MGTQAWEHWFSGWRPPGRRLRPASGQVRPSQVLGPLSLGTPVGMDEGIEAEPITPAAGEVSDADVRVAGCLPLAPDQQSFLGRQQGCASPKLLLEEQGSMSPRRGSGEAAEPASFVGGWLGIGLTLLPSLEWVQIALSSEHLISFVEIILPKMWGA